MVEMPMNFSSMITSAQQGQILIPAVYRMLNDPDFKGYNVEVEPWTPRPYDGKFHPSSHSLWTVRQLYLYLTRHDLFIEERMELTGVLAVTAGKFWHRFFQLLWLDSGELVQDEVPIAVPYLNMVGHADGKLANGEALEIKTINEFQIQKIDNEKVLREKKPGYWGQSQDYLLALGLKVMRYFTFNPVWPFYMGEFTVHADEAYQIRRAGEYRSAYELAQRYPDGALADDLQTTELPTCCAPKSKTAQSCFARLACPVGRFR